MACCFPSHSFPIWANWIAFMPIFVEKLLRISIDFNLCQSHRVNKVEWWLRCTKYQRSGKLRPWRISILFLLSDKIEQMHSIQQQYVTYKLMVHRKLTKSFAHLSWFLISLVFDLVGMQFAILHWLSEDISIALPAKCLYSYVRTLYANTNHTIIQD